MTAPRVGARLRAIRDRGGKVVVIDPRRSETGRVASEHRFIRPGRDALLLLSMVREVLAAGLEDRAFLARWCAGWERLPALLEPFAPERVAPQLGDDLDPDTIRRLARELARGGPAAVYPRVGVCNTEFAALTVWSALLLNLVTGNVDRPGGVMFPDGPVSWLFRHGVARGSYGAWRSPQGWPEVAGEYPCHVLAEQVERGLADPAAPEAVFGLVTFAGNPVLSAANGRRLDRALERLEFMVAVDVYESETARHAHVLLPPRSSLHEPHFDPLFSHFAVEDLGRWSPPVLPPPPGMPSELEVIRRLACGVARRTPGPGGLAGLSRALLLRAAPWLTLERALGPAIRFGPWGAGLNPLSRGLTLARLRRLARGTTPRPLRPRLRERVRTPDRRIQCAPAPLVDDLPRLRALLEAPPDGDELVLIGRRQLRSNNSWMHNLPGLVGAGRCTLLVHPEDARARGLAAGQRVRVRSRVGEVEVEAEPSDEVARGVVSLPHGWGHAQHGGAVARAHAGASANDLTDDALFDPVSGNSALNGVPVELLPVEAAPAVLAGALRDAAG